MYYKCIKNIYLCIANSKLSPADLIQSFALRKSELTRSTMSGEFLISFFNINNKRQ